MRPSISTRSKTGEPVSVAFRRLQAALSLNAPKLVANPNLQRRITPHGTVVKYMQPDTWDHPFRVSANIEYVSVSPGTVNGVVPYINSTQGGFLRLNGLDANGKFDYANGLPYAKLDMGKVNDDGGIYVMVRTKRNKSLNSFGTKIDKEGNVTVQPEDLQIVQESEFEGPTASGEANEFGYHPIGFIQLDANRQGILAVSQVCHFNLKYAFQDRRATLAEIVDNPTRLTIGRHVFFPV